MCVQVRDRAERDKLERERAARERADRREKEAAEQARLKAEREARAAQLRRERIMMERLTKQQVRGFMGLSVGSYFACWIAPVRALALSSLSEAALHVCGAVHLKTSGRSDAPRPSEGLRTMLKPLCLLAVQAPMKVPAAA